MKNHYPEVFHKELGTIKRVKALIQVPDGEIHRYFKLRTLAYILQGPVVREIEQLQAASTIVTHSEWAVPIVLIGKTDRIIQICETRKLR